MGTIPTVAVIFFNITPITRVRFLSIHIRRHQDFSAPIRGIIRTRSPCARCIHGCLQYYVHICEHGDVTQLEALYEEVR